MKSRILFVVASVLAGIATIAFVLFAASQATSSRGFFTFSQNQSAQESRDGLSILARRLTSIPFGIQDNLTLFGEGQTVHVQGHGDCPAGGEDFRVKVTISQDSFDGLAVGSTEGQCVSGGRAFWEVDVKAPGPKAFTPGEARACGHAVVHTGGGGDVVGDWCKTVNLSFASQ